MTLRPNVAVYCCREDRGNVRGARCLRRRRGAMGRDGRRGTAGPVSREGQRFNPVGSHQAGPTRGWTGRIASEDTRRTRARRREKSGIW